MPYIRGNNGFISFKRSSGQHEVEAEVAKADVNLGLNRVAVESPADDLITGDRVAFKAANGLHFLPAVSGVTPTQASFYVQRNNIDGKSTGLLRFFNTFTDAINNIRANEITVTDAWPAGVTKIPITYKLEDVDYQTLGDVTSYNFTAERAAIDVTTLGDQFRGQYEAGLLSGAGSISCVFNYETTSSKEASMVMLQVMNRVSVGSAFDCQLFLAEGLGNNNDVSIFYEFTGLITSAGVDVSSENLILCEVDFVTTGEINYRVGPIGATLAVASGGAGLVRSIFDTTYLTIQASD